MIRTRSAAFRWWLVLGGFCVFSTAAAGAGGFWVSQVFWGLFALWGAWLMRPITEVPVLSLPGTEAEVFPMQAGIRFGRVLSASFLLLILLAVASGLTFGSPFLIIGMGSVIVLPALVLFYGRMQRLFAPGTFTFQINDTGLRMYLDAPLDFLFTSLIQVRRDRNLWLVKSRDGREEWIDLGWMGKHAQAFDSLFRAQLTAHKVPVEDRGEVPSIRKV